MPRDGNWTPARIAALTRDWADPEIRSSEIARSMEITRGAVCGKADRLGLGAKAVPLHWAQHGGSGRPAKPAAAPRPAKAKSKQQPLNHPFRPAGGHRKPPTSPRLLEPSSFMAPVAVKPKLLKDLGPRECKWPLAGQADRPGWMEQTLFCAAVVAPKRRKPEELSSYCRCHRDLAVHPSMRTAAPPKGFADPRRNRHAVFDVGARSSFQ